MTVPVPPEHRGCPAAHTTRAGAEPGDSGDVSARGGAARLRVMSYNVRFASDRPPNAWHQRRPVMSALLRREAPHLLGTQEGDFRQLRDIAHDLGPRYEWLGTGRDGGGRGEFMAVFFDARRCEPLDYDHFWLSDTPNVVASNTWGTDVPRMVTWVRLRHLRTGRQFYAVNTHFDHRVEAARQQSAALLIERLRALDEGLPRVVTGDFNVPAHGDPLYDALLSRAGLVDCWDVAERRGADYATFHGYRAPVRRGDRIDWILVSRRVRVREAYVNTFARDGQFPSDHLPVQTVLEL